jgi:TetR/AcrR family transcriptional regulator, transcriptional repressor for nem operon
MVGVERQDVIPRPSIKAGKTAETAKTRLLDAALSVIRTKGYSATSVDELCAAAGATKGAFFHHFKSKEELGVAVAGHWSEAVAALFADGAYHEHAAPLDRILGYLELRKTLLRGGAPDFTCLAGTMVQETYETAPAIREACERSIVGHASTLEADIEAAMRERNMAPDWTAKSLALHTQAVIQGAIILAKATRDPEIGVESVNHLIRYVKLLFSPKRQPTLSKKPRRKKRAP